MTKNITFTLPAEAVEGASEAILLGDFNNWNPEYASRLEKQQDGSYKTVVSLEVGQTYNYRFLLNDGRWVNDYHAQSYLFVPGLYIDNCVLTVQESTVEENKEVQPITTTATNKKITKSQPGAIKESSQKAEPVIAKTAKKVTAKTKAAKSTKTKSAGAKVKSQKVEKSAKAVKKTVPEAKK